MGKGTDEINQLISKLFNGIAKMYYELGGSNTSCRSGCGCGWNDKTMRREERKN